MRGESQLEDFGNYMLDSRGGVACNKSMKFSAVVEFLADQKAAILTLTDWTGEWAGSSRVEGRTRSEVYERAYSLAAFNAESKGGRLERFSKDERADKTICRDTCSALVIPTFLRRPANALNVEPVQPMGRCLDKKPSHWPQGSSALRWLASGGQEFVFGVCSNDCPREKHSPLKRVRNRSQGHR